jgi:hypothetical protein
VLVIVIANLSETPLSPEEQVRKAAEDKRIEESNKKRFDTLQSATSAATIFDPYLKYEFGIFHALDLTLSTLNAATASAIANKLCSTYHLSGGLRVYLADGHLAAQCDFLPDIKETTAPISNSDAEKEREFDAAKNKMMKCVQKLDESQAGGSRSVVDRVIKNSVDICGPDFIALMQRLGLEEEQSRASALVYAYEALGCRYSNPMDPDTMPEERRAITCSRLR